MVFLVEVKPTQSSWTRRAHIWPLKLSFFLSLFIFPSNWEEKKNVDMWSSGCYDISTGSLTNRLNDDAEKQHLNSLTRSQCAQFAYHLFFQNNNLTSNNLLKKLSVWLTVCLSDWLTDTVKSFTLDIMMMMTMREDETQSAEPNE